MDLSKIYFDSNGKKGNILQIVALEPEWAAKRIQEGEKAIARITELEAALTAAQERNTALQSEHLNHVNALHEQLTAMTAERDSESRWAKHYSDKVTELEQQLAAMQRIIDSYKDDIRADTPTEKEVFNSAANAWHRKAIEDSNKIITMEKELEVERMRLALCGGAADANTRTMATERINKDNPYYSSSYERVCDAVDREMDLREQLAAAQEREVAYRNALMDAAKDFDQAGMGNCCQRVLDELNRIINASEADHAESV